MAWIRAIEPDEAGEDLSRVYSRIVEHRGKLSHIMQVQSLQPKAMEAHLELYMAIMYFKFVNRIAQGLEVEPTAEELRGSQY